MICNCGGCEYCLAEQLADRYLESQTQKEEKWTFNKLQLSK